MFLLWPNTFAPTKSIYKLDLCLKRSAEWVFYLAILTCDIEIANIVKQRGFFLYG